MDWNNAFMLVNALVMPAWALLIFLPRSPITKAIVHSALYPVIMGAIYIVCLTASIFFGQSAEGVGFSSIEAVSKLFDHPNGVIVGWTHYLVFDLFVGAWIGRDAIRQSLPHLAVIPCILGAYVFGPLGLMLYFGLRFALRRKLFLEE